MDTFFAQFTNRCMTLLSPVKESVLPDFAGKNAFL
jgi:hypothetical protein